MTNKEQKRIDFLLSKGFKKITPDKQDEEFFWYERKFKLGEFQAKLCYDGKFCEIFIEVLTDEFHQPTSTELLWRGGWHRFLLKNTEI